jgi:hypothetical protein
MIPSSIRDVTVGWLNERVAGQLPAIAAFTWEDLGEGVGILGEVSRVHLTYVEPSDDAPVTLITKFASPFPENVFLAQAMGFYDREVNFYNQAAAGLAVRTPRCYFAEIAPDGASFALVLEEIPGATMIDQLQGATVEQSAQVFDLLASVHAGLWESDQLYGFGWLPPMNNPMYKGSQALAEAKLPSFLATWTDRLPATTLAAVEAFIPRYPEFLDWAVDQGGLTMAHTDCRAENYLWSNTGELAMIDFQFLTRFWGAWDVANWLGASLTTDDRRANQDALVEGYHAGLVARGVKGYSLDRCWRDIRASLLVQTFSAVVVSDLDGANDRGRQLLETIYERNFLTAEDNDVAEALTWF